MHIDWQLNHIEPRLTGGGYTIEPKRGGGCRLTSSDGRFNGEPFADVAEAMRSAHGSEVVDEHPRIARAARRLSWSLCGAFRTGATVELVSNHGHRIRAVSGDEYQVLVNGRNPVDASGRVCRPFIVYRESTAVFPDVASAMRAGARELARRRGAGRLPGAFEAVTFYRVVDGRLDGTRGYALRGTIVYRRVAGPSGRGKWAAVGSLASQADELGVLSPERAVGQMVRKARLAVVRAETKLVAAHEEAVASGQEGARRRLDKALARLRRKQAALGRATSTADELRRELGLCSPLVAPSDDELRELDAMRHSMQLRAQDPSPVA
jgi:hypothetical protein